MPSTSEAKGPLWEVYKHVYIGRELLDAENGKTGVIVTRRIKSDCPDVQPYDDDLFGVVWQADDGTWPWETALSMSTHAVWANIKDFVQEKFIVPTPEMAGPELRLLVMKLQQNNWNPLSDQEQVAVNAAMAADRSTARKSTGWLRLWKKDLAMARAVGAAVDGALPSSSMEGRSSDDKGLEPSGVFQKPAPSGEVLDGKATAPASQQPASRGQVSGSVGAALQAIAADVAAEIAGEARSGGSLGKRGRGRPKKVQEGDMDAGVQHGAKGGRPKIENEDEGLEENAEKAPSASRKRRGPHEDGDEDKEDRVMSKKQKEKAHGEGTGVKRKEVGGTDARQLRSREAATTRAGGEQGPSTRHSNRGKPLGRVYQGATGRHYPPHVSYAPGDKLLENWLNKLEYYKDDVDWEVEAVVDEVGQAGPVPHMVLVKWKGFELDFNTGWEPAKKGSDMAKTSHYLDWKKGPKPAYYTAIDDVTALANFKRNYPQKWQ